MTSKSLADEFAALIHNEIAEQQHFEAGAQNGEEWIRAENAREEFVLCHRDHIARALRMLEAAENPTPGLLGRLSQAIHETPEEFCEISWSEPRAVLAALLESVK